MSFNFKYKERSVSHPPTYAPAKRRLSRIYWYLVLLLLLSPFAYIAFKYFSETCLMRANGNVFFGETVVRSPAGAYVSKLPVRVGSSFEKGQTLVELRNPTLDAQIDSLAAEIDTLNRKKAAHLSDNAEIDRLLRARADEELNLGECRADLDALKKLKEQCQVSLFDLSRIRYDYDQSQQQLGALDAAIAKCMALKSIQAEESFDRFIRDCESKLRQAKIARNALDIKASEDGTVCKLLVELDEYVKDGQDLAQLSLKRDVRIIAYVESRFISPKLNKGQDVRILMPDKTVIPGFISEAPVLAENDPATSGITLRKGKRMIVFRVKAKDDLPEQYRISGLPVEVLFY